MDGKSIFWPVPGLTFHRGELNEKDSNRKCVCRVDWCGRACGDGLWPREKGQRSAAKNYALRRFEVDADYKGLRSCDGGWRSKRRGGAVRGAPSVRGWRQNSGALAPDR